MKNDRILYLDVLKIVATILVIINHSHWHIVNSNFFISFIHIFIFGLCKIAVPIFIMASGALILNRNTTYKKILKKRIPRVYAAMIISTIVGCIFYNLDIVTTLIKSIFGSQTSKLYFLWYIYLIITLYIITPIIKKQINEYNEEDYKILFIVFIIVPSTIIFISDFSQLALKKYKLIEGIIDNFSYLTYIGYYIFGYYISNKNINNKIKNKSIIYFLTTLFLCMTYLLIGYSNTKTIIEISRISLPVAIMSICIFIIFKYYFEKSINSKLVKKIVIAFSESSFGVYLFHLYWIEYLIKTNIVNKYINYRSIIGYSIFIFLIFLSLSIFFYLLRKIKIFKKIF